MDPYVNRTDQPRRPLVNEWTEIRRDFQRISIHRPVEPFLIYMEEIEAVMGRREGIQVSRIFCSPLIRPILYTLSYSG